MTGGADVALDLSCASPTTLARVIVTRPALDGQAWAEALQALGVPCEPLPLIDIAALPDAAALAADWQGLARHLAVMFVSANAVRFFMAARPTNGAIGPCRAWSTGPGTRAALLSAAWPAGQIDSPDPASLHFDSEALWALVSARVHESVQANVAMGCPKPTVLIVRGADAQGHVAGRDWLAQTLGAAGLRVLQSVAYVRQAPVWTPAQQGLAHQAVLARAWWLFSSFEAAQHLLQVCPDLALPQARALATHPRIAERLVRAAWGRVELVPADLAAQALSIKSLL